MLEKPVDFGRRIGVSRQCVADYVKRKQINGDALVGAGRTLMIDVEKATAQLARRLDPDKRLTNGRAKLDQPAPAAKPDRAMTGDPLSGTAEQVWLVLSTVPALAAWETARPGESLQRAFDAFMNMRLNVTADMRLRAFALDDDALEPVDWADLAEEMGLDPIDPETMRADWQARRDAP